MINLSSHESQAVARGVTTRRPAFRARRHRECHWRRSSTGPLMARNLPPPSLTKQQVLRTEHLSAGGDPLEMVGGMMDRGDVPFPRPSLTGRGATGSVAPTGKVPHYLTYTGGSCTSQSLHCQLTQPYNKVPRTYVRLILLTRVTCKSHPSSCL